MIEGLIGLGIRQVPGDDVNAALPVGGHRRVVDVVPALRDRPANDAGRVHSDETAACDTDLCAELVFPGASDVVAVGIHEVVVARCITRFPPAPSCMKTAVGIKDRHVEVGIAVGAGGKGSGVGAATRGVLADGVPGAGGAAVFIQHLITPAGAADAVGEKQFPGRRGNEARIGDLGLCGAAIQSVPREAEHRGVPGGRGRLIRQSGD